MEKKEKLIITDTKIIEFYKENPNLDIVSLNHIFIDILKKLSTNLTSTMTNTINTQILNSVNELKSDIKTLNSSLQIKMHEVKKDYIEEMKVLISNTELTINEKMNFALNKNIDSVISRMTLLVNDIVPKTQDNSYKAIESCIQSHTEQLLRETNKILVSTNPENKMDTTSQLEKTFNTMIQTVNQTIHTSIQTSEGRTTHSLMQIQDKLTIQKQVQDTLHSELTAFLGKYKNNSSVKGNIAEMELYYMLQKIAPTDEIIRCSNETATCDFKLKRKFVGLPTILFESKDYTATVNTDEVYKFERDLQLQRCHGIFISQNSPITFKENYHIDIIDGIIHLYISNVRYDVDKVKIGISIIDHLANKLDIADVSETEKQGVTISQEDFAEIKDEYVRFAIKKNEMIDSTKLFCKQLVDKLDDIKLPVFQRITGNTEKVNFGIMCEICRNFWGKNQQAISAHKRKCRDVFDTSNTKTTEVNK